VKVPAWKAAPAGTFHISCAAADGAGTAIVFDSCFWHVQVEPIALVAQAPETGFVGVYLYCDDQAAIKQLPLNPRATGIANAAGLHIQVGLT
jgi:hypothetical protein